MGYEIKLLQYPIAILSSVTSEPVLPVELVTQVLEDSITFPVFSCPRPNMFETCCWSQKGCMHKKE